MCEVYKTSNVYNIIVKVYKNIQSCVFLGNTNMKYFASNAGVRQDVNLSPLLFALYMSDVENYLLSKEINYIEFYNVANNLINYLFYCMLITLSYLVLLLVSRNHSVT